jgi:flagellar protein FlaJ
VLVVVLFFIVGFLVPISIFPFLNLAQYGITKNLSLPASLIISLVVGIMLAFVVALIAYMHLYYLIAERARRVETVLPDFLLMVAANLRSGMTPFAAFQASARPEFGPLQNEILYVSSSSLGTESFSDSLSRLTENIDSDMLRRIVVFFENGLKSGGKLAYLLEVSAEEIRETQEMRNQMLINTKSYAIFVVFILLFGLPMLLAISSQFLVVFTKIQSNVSRDSTSSIGVGGLISPQINLKPDFIENLAFFIIVGSSIFTSIMVGVISEGKLLYGLKYMPPLAFGALVFFFIFKSVIAGMLGSLI